MTATDQSTVAPKSAMVRGVVTILRDQGQLTFTMANYLFSASESDSLERTVGNVNAVPTVSSSFIFRSSFRNDLIKWVGMSVRLLTFSVFFYLLSYYWAEYLEFSQDDTRHESAQSLCSWFCDFRSHDPKMRSKCPMAFIYFLSYYLAENFQTSYDDIIIIYFYEAPFNVHFNPL